MAGVSLRMTADAIRRARRNGWRDPRDTTKPGCVLPIKLNNGTYTRRWFRYDLGMTWKIYQGVHLEGLVKVRPGQIPEGRPHRTS